MADDIPGERWLPIPGYEGRYDVSDHGRVRSWQPIGRHVTEPPAQPRMRALTRAKRGVYPVVSLSMDGKHKTRVVHRLVLLAFVGPAPEGQEEVRHLDGDPTNNRLINLAYGTRSENILDAVQHGTHYARFAGVTHCVNGHPFDDVNTYHFTTVRGGPGRQCKECNRIRQRQYKREKRYA